MIVKTLLILTAASGWLVLFAEKGYSFEIGPTLFILLSSLASALFSYLANRRAGLAEAKIIATAAKVSSVAEQVKVAAVDRKETQDEVKHITALVNSSNAQLATVAVKKDDEIRTKDRELQDAKAELASLKMLAAAQTVTAAQAVQPRPAQAPEPLKETLKAIDEVTGQHVGEVAIEPPDKIKIKPTGDHVGEVKVTIAPEDRKE